MSDSANSLSVTKIQHAKQKLSSKIYIAIEQEFCDLERAVEILRLISSSSYLQKDDANAIEAVYDNLTHKVGVLKNYLEDAA